MLEWIVTLWQLEQLATFALLAGALDIHADHQIRRLWVQAHPLLPLVAFQAVVIASCATKLPYPLLRLKAQGFLS